MGRPPQEVLKLFKTNADLQNLVQYGLVQRLCCLPIVPDRRPDRPGSSRSNSLGGAPAAADAGTTPVDDDIRVCGVELLEALCACNGPKLCEFVWLALLNNMNAHLAASLAVLHLLVLCRGQFSDFFLAWRPVGLLSSL